MMKRSLSMLGVTALVAALAAPAGATDFLIPGKLFIAKTGGKLVKVLSKGIVYDITPDPTVSGASLHVFDTGTIGGDDTYNLPAGQWSGLGNPPGAKGWKYKGAGTAADPCKIVLIKDNLIKAVCKDKGAGGVLMTPPFGGNAGVVLNIGADNYCAEFEPSPTCVEIKNDVKLVKRKEPCPAPAMCPSVGPPPCPLTAGIYTNTQTSGGMLTVDGITPFPFPTGGVIVQHVSSASTPTCVHTTVVPDPGGFSAPLFCIPSLNFSVQVTQDGCGVGRIDSNGGSDFTIEEIGDTSAPGAPCGLPASNCNTPPGDSNVRVDVDVGTNGADTCGAGLEANAAVSVPVHTITWAHVPTINCVMSGPDTTGPGGMGDTTVVEFDQTLDFTTDATSADWSDLDPDGCCLAGNGPASVQLCAFGGGGPGGLSGMGTCIDLDGVNMAGADVTTVAAGTIGSNGSPLYDLTFLTSLPNAVTGPSGAPTASCGSPPLINFTGSVTRCVP